MQIVEVLIPALWNIWEIKNYRYANHSLKKCWDLASLLSGTYSAIGDKEEIASENSDVFSELEETSSRVLRRRFPFGVRP